MNKKYKGFTLIELLAVIIVLAVIAVIAVPIVIDVIEDARNSANKDTVYGIINAGKYYYAESMLDDSKKYNVENIQDIYNLIELSGEKPKDGKLYVNESGQVALSVIIGNKCYVKNFYNELQELDKEDSNCDLGYVSVDKINPTLILELIEGTIGNDNWYTTETYVKVKVIDEESGFANYKWCQGLNCTPNEIETTNESSKLLVDSSEAQICVQGFDMAGNVSEVICSEVVKVDITKPEINGVEDLTVKVGEEVDLKEGVEVEYTISDKAGNVQTSTRKVIVSADAPDITFEEEENAINEYGWAKEDFFVTINVIDNTGKGIKEVYVCTSNESDRCEPTDIDSSIKDNKITRLIQTESNNNRICVKAIDNDNQVSEVVCSDAYKLDKTDPVVGSINVNGEIPNDNWYKEDITITTNDGIDSLSGHLETIVDINSITENTANKTVTVTTKDKAGNTSTKIYNVKLDKTKPTVTIAKTTNSTKLTATVTPGTTESNYTYTWYKDGSVISGATTNTYTPTTAGKYNIKVTTGSGITATSNEVTIQSYTVTYNLNGGTGTISNQTKVEDISLTLSSSTPTRSGYEFIGWGSSANDTSVDYASGASYTGNENKTLYAIWKKTVAITFNGNGATIDKTSTTCDMYNADTSCKVTFPIITRDGFTITGFNTFSSATTATVESGKEASVSSNATYYAITSKEITVTFYRNGATSITPKGGNASTLTSLTQKCTIRNGETNCSITSPTITASTNTPSVLGWNTSANSTSSAWNENTSKTFTSNASYYAITKKDAITYTATFNANNATLVDTANTDSAAKDSCTIDAVYNGAIQGTSCTVYSPNITAPSATPTVVGFHTSSTGSTNAWSVNSAKSISSDVTYYAITKKDAVTYTATFNANNATLVDTANTDSATKDSCTIDAVYNGATQGASCTVYSPNITAPSATPTVVGFHTSSTGSTNAWSVNSAKSISSDVTYYAITKKDAVTYNITYAKGTGVSAIGATSGSCGINATYNGTKQSTTCSITLPTITASTGYTASGWYNSSGTKLGNASASITVSASQTITAKATVNSYTCSAGYYLKANATSCTKCEAGSYCGGGTYNYSSSVQGKTTCPSGYGSSVAGSDASNDCYKTITVTYSGNGNTGGSTENSSCKVYYNNGSCSITLNSNGFTKTNYTFQGWGTGTSSVSHSAGTSYSFSSNTTLNAIWKSAKICIRATTLHTETCPDFAYDTNCERAYNAGTTITYGNKTTTSGVLNSGDAFDCDVNGDGTYDSATERFYYVSDLYDTTNRKWNSDYATLIYYNNTGSVVKYDSSDYNYYGPRTAITKLPTTSQWKNVKLSSTTRAILDHSWQSTSTDGVSYPNAFSYEEYAARLLTTQELVRWCNVTSWSSLEYGDLDSCLYLLENAGFTNTSITGYWLETPGDYSSMAYIVNGEYRSIGLQNISVTNSGTNTYFKTRPVIEVKKTDMSY